MAERGYLKLRSVLFDRVTGLPAFPVHFDQLRTLLDTGNSVGVIHLEIRGLGMVESLYGWQVFDRIVARAAATLREAVGQDIPGGSLLAQNSVAGDRFLVFVCGPAGETGTGVPSLAAAAEALRRRLDLAFAGPEFAGLSPAPCFDAGHAALRLDPFYRFERRVYAAIDEARGAHERRERGRAASWGEELASIIRSRAVTAWFQPVVHLETREVLGHEALARGPRDSVLEAPRAMFDLSTRVGLSEDLDLLCRQTAIEAFAGLGRGGKLFLNLLPAGLDREGWHRGRLRAHLSDLGLDPSQVVLELSERGPADDEIALADRMARAKGEGFAVALDDVGTGCSGLAAIERARPDYIKLDPTLVRGIESSRLRQEILRGLAQVAGNIGASVIAEGVETRAEAEIVAATGARYAQGYLFATPAPAAPATIEGPA